LIWVYLFMKNQMVKGLRASNTLFSHFEVFVGLITFWIVRLILNCHFEPNSHFSRIIISFVNLFWIVTLIIVYYFWLRYVKLGECSSQRLHFVMLGECLCPSYFVWIIFDAAIIFWVVCLCYWSFWRVCEKRVVFCLHFIT